MTTDKKTEITSHIQAKLPEGWKIITRLNKHQQLSVIVTQMPKSDYDAMAYESREHALAVCRPLWHESVKDEELLSYCFYKGKDTVAPKEIYISPCNPEQAISRFKETNVKKKPTQKIFNLIRTIEELNTRESDIHADYCNVSYWASLYFGTEKRPLKLV